MMICSPPSPEHLLPPATAESRPTRVTGAVSPHTHARGTTVHFRPPNALRYAHKHTIAHKRSHVTHTQPTNSPTNTDGRTHTHARTHTHTHTYSTRSEVLSRRCSGWLQNCRGFSLGLYKIFVYMKAFMHERIIPCLPLPICIAHTIAILLQGHFAIYDPPQTTLLYAIHHTK